MPPRPPSDVVVDARWLGYTGVGRVTDLFLRGLDPGDQRWTVWTRAGETAQPPPHTTSARTGHAPTALFAQRDALAVPKATSTLWLHAVRPLVPRATAVFVHDLIPVTRYPPAARRLWHAFFRLSVAPADRIVVNSAATQASVEELLRVPTHKIHQVDMTIDTTIADRARAKRATGPRSGHLLYVGQLKGHKNVAAAIAGFARSAAARDRELVIAGGQPADVNELRRVVEDHHPAHIHLAGRCTDDELADLMANAGALIQPSLEEGFGLTVLEALVAGVPVCCSDIAAHREAARGLAAATFDPTDVDAIADAIDTALAADDPEPPTVPTPAEFAADVVRAAGLR